MSHDTAVTESVPLGESGLVALRPHAEQAATPPSWPPWPRPTTGPGRRPGGCRRWAVVTYLLGGTLADGTVITPKYVGPRRLIEVAVATLATDRALLLLGVPGTAKTWVSEHLAAAISRRLDAAGPGHRRAPPEEAIRYGWNYARLLAEGPSRGRAGAARR